MDDHRYSAEIVLSRLPTIAEKIGSGPELMRLLGEVETATGLTDEDAVPEVGETPVSKPGDVWFRGNHRVMCGDATRREDIERLMDGSLAGMVFTDPPYGMMWKTGDQRLSVTTVPPRGNSPAPDVRGGHLRTSGGLAAFFFLG